MNKELYESLKDQLQSLGEDFSPAVVRQMLFDNLKAGLSLGEVIAILTAFYDCTHEYESFSFLYDYCKNVFSGYYNNAKIANDIEKIANDRLLIESILKVCNDDVVCNLLINLNDYNELCKKNYSYDCQQIYDWVYGVCEIRSRANDKYAAALKKVNEAPIITGETDSVINPNDNYNFVNQAAAAAEQNKINDLINQLNNKNDEITEQRIAKADEVIGDAATKLNVDADKLYKKIDKSDADIYEIDKIEVDSRLLAFATRFDSLPRNRFQRMVQKVQDKIVFNDLKLTIADVDGNRVVTIAPGAKMDKFASTSKDVVESIINAANKKRSVIGMISDFGRGFRDGFKAVFKRNKKGYDEKSSKRIPTSYEDLYTGRHDEPEVTSSSEYLDSVPDFYGQYYANGEYNRGASPILPLSPASEEARIEAPASSTPINSSSSVPDYPMTETVNRRSDGSEFVIRAWIKGANKAGILPKEPVKKGRIA